jgi:hypothetical protein
MSKDEIWKRLTTPKIEDLMEREKIRLAKEEENVNYHFDSEKGKLYI